MNRRSFDLAPCLGCFTCFPFNPAVKTLSFLTSSLVKLVKVGLRIALPKYISFLLRHKDLADALARCLFLLHQFHSRFNRFCERKFPSFLQNSFINGRNSVSTCFLVIFKCLASQPSSFGTRHFGDRHIKIRRSKYVPRSHLVRWFVSANQTSVHNNSAGNAVKWPSHGQKGGGCPYGTGQHGRRHDARRGLNQK